MASSDSQIDKPQCGRPKRVELPDVNINTGMQSINTESLFSLAIGCYNSPCKKVSVALCWRNKENSELHKLKVDVGKLLTTSQVRPLF